MTLAQIIEAIATLSLGSFFIIITVSFFKFRLVRKQEELEDLVSSMNLGQTQSFKKSIEKEFAPKDYILPLTFVTIVSYLGLYLLLLGWSLYDVDSNGLAKSMLWSGSDFWADPVYGREKKSLAIVGWSLLGAFLSGAQYIYRRFATIDLTPGNFFSIGIRMVLAPVISLMIAFLIGADEPELMDESSNTILVLAFLTGLFPERGFKMIMDKVSSIFPKENKNVALNLPLEAIQGISYFHRLRLNEIGIDNVQNLAQFNFLLLIIKTPFPVRTLLDWVSQAKLMIEFQDTTPNLLKVGIRSALDFIDALKEHPDRLKQIAEITGINELALEINLKNIEQDKSIWLLGHFKENLEQVSVE